MKFKSNSMTHTLDSFYPGSTTRKHQKSESLTDLAAALEALQLKRLVLKSVRDEMGVTGGLGHEQDKVFNRRFDELTTSALNLADAAAMHPARTVAQLRDKAKFVFELIEPEDSSVLDRMIWSLVTDLVAYATETLQGAEEEAEHA